MRTPACEPVLDILTDRPATVIPQPLVPPRAQGAARLCVEQARGGTRIAVLRQSGALKLLFPRPVGPACEAVILNCAGGLTGGDRFQMGFEAGADAHLVLSTQAAERSYRALGDSQAEVLVYLHVEARARIDWLPQETILYDGSALKRRLRVDLAASARLLLVEPVIFGRVAMGEVLHQAALRDRWEVRQDGSLVFADALHLSGDLAAQVRRTGLAGGAGAMASLLFVGPEAAGHAASLRSRLPVTAGVSSPRDGLLFARLLARDGFELRRSLIPVIECLSGAPLPKVWRL